MNRLFIFLAVGPLLGAVVMIIIMSIMAGQLMLNLWTILALPVIYIFGIAPALVTVAWDWFSAAILPPALRVIFTSCVGAIVVVTLTNLVHGVGNDILLVAAIGGIPAGMCSILSGERHVEPVKQGLPEGGGPIRDYRGEI